MLKSCLMYEGMRWLHPQWKIKMRLPVQGMKNADHETKVNYYLSVILKNIEDSFLKYSLNMSILPIPFHL